MARRDVALVALTFVLLNAASVAADPIRPVVLGSGVIGTGGGFGGPTGTVDPAAMGVFLLELPPVSDFVSVDAGLFRVTLAPTDVGRTVRATAETDPAFGAMAALLTNGVDDIYLHTLHFPDNASFRTLFFETDVFGTAQVPDFKSFTITALTFQLLELQVRADTTFREIRYRGILSVEGLPASTPVPEPATLLLVATGSLAALFGAKRRRVKEA
jgi:hypothetical protein